MDEVKIKGFFLLGISVRTTNAGGQAIKDISQLWERFMAKNLLLQIEDRITDEIYCVYTDYKSDHNGFYTAVLGCKVNSTDNIPEGLISLIVAPGNYQRYIASGKLPDCVANTWQYIWSLDINRKYIADFDVYGVKAQNSADAEVEIYVGIK